MLPQTQKREVYNPGRKELILTRCDLTALTADVISEFGQCTEYLDVSHNRLRNLHWIYAFQGLKCLILDGNRLREAHFQKLKQPMPHLKVLMLNKNELSDLSTTIAVLSRIFPSLEYLSLHGNPICPDGLELQPFSEYVSYEYDYYRTRITSSFSQLKFLDHSAVQHAFVGTTPQLKARVLTFTPKILWAKLKNAWPSARTHSYSALPTRSRRPAGYHCGFIRKKTNHDYEYNGLSSEGNRFITNNDL